MKLSKQDLRILIKIRSSGRPMTNSEISQETGLYRGTVYRRIKRMQNLDILQVIHGKPEFYQINHSQNPIRTIVVVCPKCEKMHVISPYQSTLQCCPNGSGHKHRFRITKSRIQTESALKSGFGASMAKEEYEEEEII